MIYGIGLAGSMPFGFGPAAASAAIGGAAAAAAAADKPDPGLEKLALASGGGYFELTAAAISTRRSRASSTNCTAST